MYFGACILICIVYVENSHWAVSKTRIYCHCLCYAEAFYTAEWLMGANYDRRRIRSYRLTLSDQSWHVEHGKTSQEGKACSPRRRRGQRGQFFGSPNRLQPSAAQKMAIYVHNYTPSGAQKPQRYLGNFTSCTTFGAHKLVRFEPFSDYLYKFDNCCQCGNSVMRKKFM